MEGWLEKKGSFIKNWKRRWFSLTPTELQYFTDDSKLDKKGSIDINASTCILTRDGSNHLFKFGIQTGNRVLELSADTEDIRLQWMDTLHTAVNTRRCDHSTGVAASTKGIAKLLPVKKSNMEADTPMNRALKGNTVQTSRKQRSGGVDTTNPENGAAPSCAATRAPPPKKSMTRRTARHHSGGDRDRSVKSTDPRGQKGDRGDAELEVDHSGLSPAAEAETDPGKTAQSTLLDKRDTGTAEEDCSPLPPPRRDSPGASTSEQKSLPEGWEQVHSRPMDCAKHV